MAVTCPIDLDTRKLRDEIKAIYGRVATDPSSEFHFHRGAGYAAERLGYDVNALTALPADATASFAGVANPHGADARRNRRGCGLWRGHGPAACSHGCWSNGQSHRC